MGLSAGQWMTILADGRSQRHEQPSVRNVQCLHGQAKSDSNGTSLVISVCGPEFKSELVRPCTERHAVYFVPTIGSVSLLPPPQAGDRSFASLSLSALRSAYKISMFSVMWTLLLCLASGESFSLHLLLCWRYMLPSQDIISKNDLSPAGLLYPRCT